MYITIIKFTNIVFWINTSKIKISFIKSIFKGQRIYR